jgi:hypothetical protein
MIDTVILLETSPHGNFLLSETPTERDFTYKYSLAVDSAAPSFGQ